MKVKLEKKFHEFQKHQKIKKISLIELLERKKLKILLNPPILFKIGLN
jgi:hypothetical protein